MSTTACSAVSSANPIYARSSARTCRYAHPIRNIILCLASGACRAAGACYTIASARRAPATTAKIPTSTSGARSSTAANAAVRNRARLACAAGQEIRTSAGRTSRTTSAHIAITAAFAAHRAC